MTAATASEQFVEAVRRLRERERLKVEASAFVLPLVDLKDILLNDVLCVLFWFKPSDGDICFLCLADIPGTLSGDVLRLKRKLPAHLQRNSSYSIIGDDIRPLSYTPPLPSYADDSEDLSEALALLPLVTVDPELHFVKKSRYVSEIRNHLACLGGTCPGVPQSPCILPLLGKSSAGELVFPKLDTDWRLYGNVHPLETYKAWILDLIDGLRFLHARGIVHRDISKRNFLWSDSDGGRLRLLIGDLEGHWGCRNAPEFRELAPRIPMTHDTAFEHLVAGWTFKSDIYDIGNAIGDMLYAAGPRGMVERPVPPPLDEIVAACTRALPEDRPSLEELRVMVERIACD